MSAQDSSQRKEPNYRAWDEKARVKRLFEGLERFVNAKDSEYDQLRLSIPGFWPLPTKIPSPSNPLGEALNWPDGGLPLFKPFRDYLRRVWRLDFPDEEGMIPLDGVYLQYLLGLQTDYIKYKAGTFMDYSLPDRAFTDGWLALCKAHRGIFVPQQPMAFPRWSSGKFEYYSVGDFQAAVYFLLSESWRARVCRICKKYFIAEKGAQVFCSIPCSTTNRLERGKRYWHDKGASLRQIKKKERKKL